VSRLVWEWAHGKIPDGVFVLHRCDTRNCVNPDHLFLGTKFDNTRDGMKKGRIAFKLTDAKVIRMRRMKASGTTYAKLSKLFHVAVPTVQCIVERRRWKHLP